MTNIKYPKRDPVKIKELLSLNFDSRQYFFSKADETWLEWLWDNGLLDEIKKKAEDPNQYSYRLPELEYLTRMAEKIPITVAEIIMLVPISKDTFNPEVIDRFLWIIGLLPEKQIKKLIPKILKEKWMQLMSPFNRSGYEYKKIVEKLDAAKDFGALIEFAKVILTLRTEEELVGVERISMSDKMFYLSDITNTGIFEAILDKDNDKKEESLKVFLEILSNIVKLGQEKENSIFAETEPFYLLDVDLFTLELNSNKRSYHREDLQNLVAVVKTLVGTIFSSTCDNEVESQRLYKSYISPLPDSLTLYRLKLFAITRCPHVFKKEIKEALFRVFNVGERYFEIDGGAEYHQGLIAGFGVLDNEVKREYISKVIEYYGQNLADKDREGWRKRDGLEILNYIKSDLNKEERSRAESIFGEFLEGDAIIPHPAMSGVMGGFVSYKSPVNPADSSVAEIIEHLKTDWSPKVLKEQFKGDNFLTPRGPEGLGEALKEDFKIRTDEYFANLNGFFDRENIDPSYVYDLLRYVEDTLRSGQKFNDDQFISLFNFFDLIKISGETNKFEKSEEKVFLTDWITVHKVAADILVGISRVIKDSKIFKDNRDKILGIIKYLLSIKSSPDIEDDKRESGEPFHVAINSVRGRAYEAFVQFTAYDGKEMSQDVKDIFVGVLDNDNSNAVRFVLGHYIATFYFKDIPFIRNLFPKIFPKLQAGKEKLYFASWEGYLANSLYKELYQELKDYYAYAITVNKEDYPDRKYLKGLDETLAAHLALAYAHFDLVPGDPIFDSFWSTPNETRHYEFASFIGRHYLTRDIASNKWFEENNVSKQKLIDFWDWMLKTDIKIEPKAFSGFGFWVNPDKEIIPDEIVVEKMTTTLQKSNGEIDWDYGLLRRLNKFAEINPEKTLDILKALLLLDDGINPNHRMYFDVSQQMKDPLEIIYKQDRFKKSVRDFVNDLISKGGRTFWDLKSIIE